VIHIDAQGVPPSVPQFSVVEALVERLRAEMN